LFPGPVPVPVVYGVILLPWPAGTCRGRKVPTAPGGGIPEAAITF